MYQGGRAVTIFCAIIIGGHAQAPDFCNGSIPVKGSTRQMPNRGFMDCCSQMGNSPELTTAIKTFLSRGGRLIDSDPFNGNAQAVGIAIHESAVPREEMWVMSTLDNFLWQPGIDTVNFILEQVDANLKAMNLTYVDVMVLNNGPQQVEFTTYNVMTYEDHLDMWRGLIEARRLGKILHLGVNDHTQVEIENLMRIEAPAVAKLALQPWMPHNQKAYAKWIKDSGIAVVAFGLFTSGGAGGCAAAKQAGEQHGVTYGQFLIRWLELQGMAFTTDLTHPQIMLEDAVCLNFNITEYDMEILQRFTLKHECKWFEKCLGQYLPGCTPPHVGRRHRRYNPYIDPTFSCPQIPHETCDPYPPTKDEQKHHVHLPIHGVPHQYLRPVFFSSLQSIGMKASMLLILAVVSSVTATAGVLISYFRRRGVEPKADLSIPLME